MESFDAKIFCGIVVFVLTSQFAHSNDCSNQKFTIELTNSTNEIFTANENTFQRITVRVKPVTSCKEWKLTVCNKNSTVCGFSVNASDVCTAQSGSHNCTCGSRSAQGQECHLNMNVTRKDNGDTLKWIVKPANTSTFSKNIRLNITYPTRLKRVNVIKSEGRNPFLVKINITVKVVCSWIPGNPRTTVNLFNSHGVMSSTTNTSRSTTYSNFTHRRCHHLEVIRCETFGSKINQSLLAMCPPALINTSEQFLSATSGQKDAFIHLFVLSHTLNITRCQLRQHKEIAVNITDVPASAVNDSRSNDLKECAVTQYSATHHLKNELKEKKTCECIVNGTVPDITVTMRLINVDEEDAGNWTLTVFNSLGNVSFNFSLSVPQSIQTSNNSALSIALVIGAVTCIIALSTIIGVRNRKMRKATVPLHVGDTARGREPSEQNGPDKIYCDNLNESLQKFGNGLTNILCTGTAILFDHYDTLRNEEIGIKSVYSDLNDMRV